MAPQLGNKEESNGGIKHMYYVPLPVPISQIDKHLKENFSKAPKVLMIGKCHQERKNTFYL
jgi:hypothetical protein